MKLLTCLALLLCAVTIRAEDIEPAIYTTALIAPVDEAPCLDCRGVGKKTSTVRTIRTHTNLAKNFLVTCRTCEGRGHLRRALRFNERLERQQARLQDFLSQHLAACHVPIAGCYVAREVAETLKPLAYARMALSHPAPCKACYGLGLEACRKCKGEGSVIERERDPETGKRVERTLPCPTCFGRSSQPCRRCDGEGLRPLCKRCDGTGVQMSKAKRDTPEQPERCRTCKGEGRR